MKRLIDWAWRTMWLFVGIFLVVCFTVAVAKADGVYAPEGKSTMLRQLFNKADPTRNFLLGLGSLDVAPTSFAALGYNILSLEQWDNSNALPEDSNIRYNVYVRKKRDLLELIIEEWYFDLAAKEKLAIVRYYRDGIDGFPCDGKVDFSIVDIIWENDENLVINVERKDSWTRSSCKSEIEKKLIDGVFDFYVNHEIWTGIGWK